MQIDPRLIGFTAIAALTFFKVRLCDVSTHRSLDLFEIELIFPRVLPLQSSFTRSPR
jgi:hypothetical protein